MTKSSSDFSVYLTAVQSRSNHDHVIKWKHFPHYWPFVRGIHGHRWIPRTNASDAEFWFLFDLRWANSWASNRYAGGLKRYRAHYDVTVMYAQYSPKYAQWISRSLPDGLRYGVVRGYHMMTSSNGNIFRVTGLLWGEFTGHRWIPTTKASNAELWCFFGVRLNKRLSKQPRHRWFETPLCSLWHHCNDSHLDCTSAITVLCGISL